MNLRTRMFTTLGCLILAMSGTSALLGWIDPSNPQDPIERPFSQVLADVQTLVWESLDPQHSDWQRLAVIGEPPAANRTTLLAAIAGEADSHFRVAMDGGLTRTGVWIDQGVFAPDSRDVRVSLARRDAESPMTRAQWNTVRALAISLEATRAPSSPGFPVFLRAPWSAIYDVASDTPLFLAPDTDATP